MTITTYIIEKIDTYKNAVIETITIEGTIEAARAMADFAGAGYNRTARVKEAVATN